MSRLQLSRPRRSGLALVLTGFLCHAPLALASGDVWVVDAAGGGDFTNLQVAVDAASDGDTLLVKPGQYVGCSLSGKGLSIVGDGAGVQIGYFGGGDPPSNPGIQISNTLVHHEVLLSGLSVWGFRREVAVSWDIPALTLSVVRGPLRIEHCSFTGDEQACSQTCDYFCEAGAAVRGWIALDVAFSHCTIQGGHSDWADYCGEEDTQGGRGVDIQGGNLSFHDCTIRGGHGAQGRSDLDEGGHGRDAIHAEDASTVPVRIYLGGCLVKGGWGGDGAYCIEKAGNGGDGVELVGPQARLWYLDSDISGGSGGCGCCGGWNGVPVRLVNGATAKPFPGQARTLLGPGPLREGETAQLEFLGVAGDRVWLLSAERAAWEVRWSFKAPLLLGTPSLQGYTFMGSVPGSGVLTVPFQAPALPPGSTVESTYGQAVFRHLNGNTRLSGSWVRVLLDSAL